MPVEILSRLGGTTSNAYPPEVYLCHGEAQGILFMRDVCSAAEPMSQLHGAPALGRSGYTATTPHSDISRMGARIRVQWILDGRAPGSRAPVRLTRYDLQSHAALTGCRRVPLQIAHGLYRFPGRPEEVEFVGILREMLRIVPNASVGLETALQLYDLSDEPTRTIHLIVHQTNTPTRKLPDVRFFRVRMPLSQFSTTRIKGMRVTTVEQTIVDLLRAGYSISEMVKIIHGAQRRRMTVELSQLQKLGERFHVKGRVERVIEAVY